MPPIRRELTLSALVSAISLVIILIGGAWFIFPLRDLPENQKQVSTEIHQIQRTLAVQTEALKTLAEITREARDIRRDLDRLDARQTSDAHRLDSELRHVKARLDTIEARRQ
jgi:chromosome segregation ATPase